MSEATNQGIVSGASVVDPEEAPAAPEADDTADILDADSDGPDVLVSQLSDVRPQPS
jgi:hypothetical protein